MSQDWFKGCDSIQEVYAKSRKLRNLGVNADEVEEASRVRKKEIINSWLYVNRVNSENQS